MKTKAVAIGCFALLLLCAWGVAAEQLEVTKDANMRARPDRRATPVGFVPKGTVLPILSQHESWYEIEYNGKRGWVYNELTNQRANADEIFTKQDVSMLPPVPVDDDEEGKAVTEKYVRVLQDNTLILYYIDPQAPFVRKARKGEWFVLASEGASWSKVKVKCEDVFYKDTSCVGDTAGYVMMFTVTGNVKSKNVEILDVKPNKDDLAREEAKTLVIGLVALGVVILIVSVIVTIRHIRAERKRNIYVQKNALILAKESKHVQYMLTNTTATMEHCFSEIGFSVNVVKDSVTARNNIENNMPDLILVDWNFETAIFAKIDNLFARMTLPAMPHFLFYNVPDPTAVPPCKALRNVNLLGITVADRDIFKVVTPLLVHQAEAEQSAKNMQKGLQRCALEGEIAGGNLLEVLQFIEIGSKTGCLMVETRGPFGLVYFSDGRIIYAAAKGPGGEPIYGVEGVYEILNQPMGKFRFITNKQPKVANLNLPTLSVLMEWTKEKDEAHRG